MYTRAVVAVCVAAALPITAFAQTVRRVPTVQPHVGVPVSRPTTAVLPGAKFRPIKPGPHTFYGTIVSLSGTTVVIKTRLNRLVNVDATDVLAAETYSAPLFVGKLVSVDGTQPASGPFVAAHIARLTNLYSLDNDN